MSNSTGILGIDPANSLGWAVSRDGKISSGVMDLTLAGSNVGRRLLRYHGKLAQLIQEHEVDCIWCEKVWVGPKTHQETARTLFGIQAITEMEAAGAGVEFHLVQPVTWRAHFLGKVPRGTKRKELKRLAIDRCRMLGIEPRTDDEAEAVGILDYGLAQAKLASISGSGPLFARGRRAMA